MNKTIQHGSLFSGIGGFDLASEWMGWNNVFHCEIDPFNQKVLKHYWPQAISYADITKTDFTIHRGRIDILTGGFPCQPYSLAGKRLGKEDARHLWPEMLRAIREIQPKWVVGENVYGLVNWSGGLVFNEVQVDLENEGYEVQPVILPACAVNAPHRRDRIWFIAYSNDNGQFAAENRQGLGKGNDDNKAWANQSIQPPGCPVSISAFIADSSDAGFESLQQWEDGVSEIEPTPQADRGRRGERDYWDEFPTQSPVCSGDDGLSSRLVGITISKHREKSIKGYGNAIVPQLAYEILKAMAYTPAPNKPNKTQTIFQR